MLYNSFQYLWPPRPDNAIPRPLLAYYESQGYAAQTKFNGTCNVVAVDPARQLHCMNRHAEVHKLWSPTDRSSAIFQNLPGAGWYVFVAELMHSKVSGGPRDTNYINDILVADGQHLVGTTFAERQDMLAALFLRGAAVDAGTHYVLDGNAWLAKNHTVGFAALYASFEKPEHEGLVLKDPTAKLAPCTRESSNTGWMVKCRKQIGQGGKNYSF